MSSTKAGYLCSIREHLEPSDFADSPMILRLVFVVSVLQLYDFPHADPVPEPSSGVSLSSALKPPNEKTSRVHRLAVRFRVALHRDVPVSGS